MLRKGAEERGGGWGKGARRDYVFEGVQILLGVIRPQAGWAFG
jgi:hypothetical protein